MGRVMGGGTRDPDMKERAANGQYGIPHRPPTPDGWSPLAWRRYLDDPDGGRSPVRHMFPAAEGTPTVAEILSQGANR